MIYTVTLNPAVDYVVHVPALIQGQILRSAREQVFFGKLHITPPGKYRT